MLASVGIRAATVDDAPRISTLLTELAEEFIVGDFAEDGRKHLLAHFAVPEMEARLQSREYRFLVAEDGSARVGVVANSVRFQPMELAAQAREPRTCSTSS